MEFANLNPNNFPIYQSCYKKKKPQIEPRLTDLRLNRKPIFQENMNKHIKCNAPCRKHNRLYN